MRPETQKNYEKRTSGWMWCGGKLTFIVESELSAVKETGGSSQLVLQQSATVVIAILTAEFLKNNSSKLMMRLVAQNLFRNLKEKNRMIIN